jgi:hypothetical protein
MVMAMAIIGSSSAIAAAPQHHRKPKPAPVKKEDPSEMSLVAGGVLLAGLVLAGAAVRRRNVAKVIC